MAEWEPIPWRGAFAEQREPRGTWRHADGSIREDHMDSRPGDYWEPWEGRDEAPWQPTHFSVDDGSEVRLVSNSPFVIENEDGERWEDGEPHLWAPLRRRHA